MPTRTFISGKEDRGDTLADFAPGAPASMPHFVIRARKTWHVFNWREFVEYRDLLYFLVLRDVTVLYKQTVLGFTWAILTPFFSMVVFSVIFGRLAKVPSDGIPYPIFSYAALLPWTYFSQSLTRSTESLIQNSAIFTKVYYPRLFIPLVPVLSKLVDLAIAFLLFIALMIYYRVTPTPHIVFVPVLIALMIAATAGLGMWLSALAIQFRDVKHAMTFATQILMYAAPVVWPVSLVPAQYRLWYGLYPMVGVIEGFRAAFIGKTEMPWDLIVVGAISSLILFLSGALYFRRTERIFADVA
jgi:lipopolysaccharide transport system permease protein